jgi:Tfp pilus assembly protein PilN
MKAVNLLPPDQRGASKATAVATAAPTGGNGAYAVLGALAIGVVAVAGYVLTTNTIKERQAKLDGLTAREQAATAKVGNLKPYADFASLASARVATVKDLAGRRFDWEQALRDLSRVVPANVTLQTLNGTVSTSSGGTGGSSLRTAIDAPAISLTGCTNTQRDVATLMARLRTIDGVTRVSLAKSSKTDVKAPDATTPAAPAVSASTPGQPGGCKPGSPPSFEMVMFFERDADAAADPAAATTTAPTAASEATAAASAASATSDTPATASPTPAAGTAANPIDSGTAQPASTTTSTGASG